ncbi:MAG: Asp-tRNA(Asn)/Glu-tRNA(Gln) amidotransferase subunit GatB [Mariniblastus sp.]
MEDAVVNHASNPQSTNRRVVRFDQSEIIIGLEVHVQLDTDSKLFCGCSTRFGEAANSQTCVVCTGMPGSLPVINQHALELSIRAGLSLNCQIARSTKWDRKNYFYPDLPKGYQISQFDQPICGPGYLDIEAFGDSSQSRRIRIERAHLEEDAGKSIHDESNRGQNSKIDLNRTGTPLLEIVTQPDLRSAAEAKSFLSELKLILNYIDVSDCNMQQGNLRCDANVNLHIPFGEEQIATPIVEIKNLNSFRAVERSITHEAQRQFEAWQENGHTIADAPKQTRGWNDHTQSTTLQREKEDSADYRYFPDPDLIAVKIEEAQIQQINSQLGPLPSDLRKLLIERYNLKSADATVIVSQGRGVVNYFLEVADGCKNSKIANNWIGQEVLRQLNESNQTIQQYPVSPQQFTELLKLVIAGTLDQTRGKEVLNEMVEHCISSQEAIKRLGIKPVDNRELVTLCEKLIAENQEVIEQIQSGNAKAIGMLIGQARKLNPNANPGLIKEMLSKMISS